MTSIEILIYGVLCAVVGFIAGYKLKEADDEDSD